LCYTLVKSNVSTCLKCSKVSEIQFDKNTTIKCKHCGYFWSIDRKGRGVHEGVAGGKFYINSNGVKKYL
jgi:hypothetical protein